MPFSSDLTDAQWEVLGPLLTPAGKRGPKHGDARRVTDALFYICHTGCQWRYLPEQFGPWNSVWRQFGRWRDNGTFDRALADIHAAARVAAGRQPEPALIIIDPSLARGASNGGVTFHDRGGPYGATNGAKRLVAVDVTGLPVATMVVPASTNDGIATELLLAAKSFGTRLEKVLVDRGTSPKTALRVGRRHGVEVERVGWDEPEYDANGRKVFRPIARAWRVEVAHGLLGRSRRLAKSFENTTDSGSAWLAIAAIRLHLRRIK